MRTKKLAKIRVRFLTVNIGTMTGKSRDVADMLTRRQVEIACVQDKKWKGNKARINWRRILALQQRSINHKKWTWYHLT